MAPVSAEEAAALLEPPADLPDVSASPALPGMILTSQRAYWLRWAPHAVDQRTLTPATAAGFRELCEVAAFKEDVAVRLQKFGSDGKSGAERMKQYTRLSQRLDACLGRFKLTAYGKPMDGGGSSKKAPSNPWAQVGAP